MVLSELQALADLMERAGAWLNIARERSKRKRSRAAARVLYDAGILVAAMRTYDNVYRSVLRRIRLLQPNAPPEERVQIVRDLDAFNDTQVIAPQIRQAYASLRAETSPDHESSQDVDPNLLRLLDDAAGFLSRAAQIEVSKGNWVLQQQVRDGVLNGATRDALEDALSFAEQDLGLLSLETLAEADHAFGRLRQRILSENDLPAPEWAVQLPS